MTQPHPDEGTSAWFWWIACHIFKTFGLFMSTLTHLGCKDEGNIGYIQTRFVHPGKFMLDNLVLHFYNGGITGRDCNMLFRDFMLNYITSAPKPLEPDWSKVPPPVPLVARPTMSQRRKPKKKGKIINECLVGGSNINLRTGLPVLQFHEEPLAGDLQTHVASREGSPGQPMDLDGSPMGPG
ncbi:hypothetical protein AX17_005582 [Amanita inopinata Kibby_2008]|nr:hypothetical protein AX17_005582 [Amanita inopinata Kibby_2008]